MQSADAAGGQLQVCSSSQGDASSPRPDEYREERRLLNYLYPYGTGPCVDSSQTVSRYSERFQHTGSCPPLCRPRFPWY